MKEEEKDEMIKKGNAQHHNITGILGQNHWMGISKDSVPPLFSCPILNFVLIFLSLSFNPPLLFMMTNGWMDGWMDQRLFYLRYYATHAISDNASPRQLRHSFESSKKCSKKFTIPLLYYFASVVERVARVLI